MDETNTEQQLQVRFVTKLASLRVADTPFALPASLTRYGLSEVVNHLLGLERPRVFDFLIDGEFLRTSLQKYLASKGSSTESVVTIEYVEALPKPNVKCEITQDDWVSSVASAGVGLLWTGSYDCIARLWNTEGKCISMLSGHSEPVTCVASIRPPSPAATGIASAEADSRSQTLFAVTASKDRTLRAWTVDKASGVGCATHEFVGHEDSVDSVAASPSANHVCSGSWDRTLRIWPYSSEQAASALAAHVRHLKTARSKSKDPKRRKRADTNEEEGSPPDASLQAVESTLVMTGHTDSVSSVVWPSEQVVYSASWDFSIRRWDVETGQEVSAMTGHKAISDISCSTQTGLIASADTDNTVRVWDPRESGGAVLKIALQSHTLWASVVAWAPHRSYVLASASYDGSLKVWDIRTKVPLQSIKAAHRDKALCLDWVPGESEVSGSGWLLVSGGTDGRVRVHTFDSPADLATSSDKERGEEE